MTEEYCHVAHHESIVSLKAQNHPDSWIWTLAKFLMTPRQSPTLVFNIDLINKVWRPKFNERQGDKALINETLI